MKEKCVKLILKNIFHLITILFFLLVALDATQNSDKNFSSTLSLTNLTEISDTTNLN